MRIGWSLDNNTSTVLTKLSDLSAHASRRLLRLGFEVHYLAHLVVCRIGRIQPDHPPLSTFNIQAGSALGMPAEAPTIATALKAMATPPARTSRPPETKDSVTADFRGGLFQVAGRASRSLERRHFGQSRRLAAGVNNHSSLDTSSSLNVHFICGKVLFIWFLLAREKVHEQICSCTSDCRFARPHYPSLCGGCENAHGEYGKAAHDGKAPHDGRPSPLSSHDETRSEANVTLLSRVSVEACAAATPAIGDNPAASAPFLKIGHLVCSFC
jgi:hypothetical protein